MNKERQGFPNCATVPLNAAVNPDTTVVLVRLSGELDLATEDAVVAVADRILCTMPKVVRLDMTGVTFCDARGLAAILRLRARLAEDQRRLTLTGVGRPLRRLLAVAELDRHLGVV